MNIRGKHILLCLSIAVAAHVSNLTNNYNTGIEPTDNKGFTDCSISHNFGEMTNATTSPTPLIPGRNYHITATVTIKKPIQWAILHFIVKRKFKNYANITFIDEKFNFCDIWVSFFNMHCPIEPGIYNYNYSEILPQLMWPGLYYSKVTIYNENGEQLLCMMKEFDIN
ncbi:PREDICTED: phosphatidylglycerol/phosphatidylinositol transfer protein-like [Amphimedon queenslandica]|uniref:MD-2-related lipid-recognition domain-containing protein n=1 Tax=Amphimedon queenslandica TaxID=400682 RepID=A0AAN0J8S4_AMPQE|nr:PREDICTED: phosphatidylglycerol/phosphatidylinositol transfer protein-like [Amphimedon queenslandica]|eukprot:XP_019853131.1 PREDICTED: phosphatidylglycerol/phosphatidylinositol transfer protein-like [Amphimedon queenslandica]